MTLKRYLILFLLLLPAFNYAQNFDNGFEFRIPPFDSLSSEYLPEFPVMPINDNSFVSSNNSGDFVINGENIIFYGTNLCNSACFPDETTSPLIARRMRQLGYNLVRIHLIDTDHGPGLSILSDPLTTRYLDPVALEKLDCLIYNLKENGIRIIMCLNVQRDYRPNDGVIDYEIIDNQMRVLQCWDPVLIELQKEYANQLLCHVNPYTNLPLHNDPVMAMVEVLNESSIHYLWHKSRIHEVAEYSEYYGNQLDSLWHDWLQQKYNSTDNLRISWNTGCRTDENILSNGGFTSELDLDNWEFLVEDNAVAFYEITHDNLSCNPNVLKVDVEQRGNFGYNVRIVQDELSFYPDSTYVISFKARSDSSRVIQLFLREHENNDVIYFDRIINLNQDWNEYKYYFYPEFIISENNELIMTFGAYDGEVMVDDIYFGQQKEKGLLPQEHLESRNVKLIEFNQAINFSDNRVKDCNEFLIDKMRYYSDQMLGYIKDTLNVIVPVSLNNWGSSITQLHIESFADYTDKHVYWDYPWNIPGTVGAENRIIFNQPLVTNFNNFFNPVQYFSFLKVAGKPNVISEYNHPFPNRYQSEGMLFGMGYAAFHDLEALLHFCYSFNNDYTTDKITNYFAMKNNTAQMVHVPIGAYVFRNNLIEAANQIVEINYTQNDIKSWGKYADDPRASGNFHTKIGYVHSTEVQTFAADVSSDESWFETLSPPYHSDTNQLTWDTENGLFSIETANFFGITGYLDRFNNRQFEQVSLVEASDFGTLSWLTTSNDSLIHSYQSLICLSSITQNVGMVWEGNTRLTDLGNEETENKPLIITLKLNSNLDSVILKPLDHLGNSNMFEPIAFYPQNNNGINIIINQFETPTMWFGLDQYYHAALKEKGIQYSYEIGQNYPNPFNSVTVIPITLNVNQKIGISIYDILGREVYSDLVDGSTGRNLIEVNFEGNSSGTYFYRINSSGHEDVRKMLYFK